MAENSDMENKQKYLRDNILNKGYDASDFMDFLKNKNGEDGLDLNKWTMEDLVDLVNEYLSQKGAGQNCPKKIPKDLNNERNDNDNDKDNDNYDNNIVNSEPAEHLKLSNIESIIKCQKIESTELSNIKNFNIKIEFPEKHESTLFSREYVTYGVNTIPLEKKSIKRYSDFDWLHKSLLTKYTNCIIPPICKKKYGNKTGPELVAKRTRWLEKFMNGISEHPLLRNSKIFYDFLSTKTENEFKELKSNYQISKPNQISDLYTLDGMLKVSLTNEDDIYLQNIIDNAEINEELMRKLVKSYKKLFELIKEINDQMSEVFYIFKKLEEHSKKYYENNLCYSTYGIMKTVMKDWVDMQKKQIVIMNRNIVDFYKFTKYEFKAMQDFSDKVNDKKQNFFNAFDDFYSKEINPNEKKSFSTAEKIEMFNDTNYANFSEMQTKDLMEAKNDYCGHLKSFISEYERLRILNGKKNKDNISNFINQLSDSLNEFSSILKVRLSVYDNIPNENDEENIRRMSSDNIIDSTPLK